MKIFNPEANGVVLAKHENTLMSSDQENSEFSEKRVLDPATEDPVARRAVRILHFKACPDTRLVSLSIDNWLRFLNFQTAFTPKLPFAAKRAPGDFISDRVPEVKLCSEHKICAFI